jgi:hypothetical protein
VNKFDHVEYVQNTFDDARFAFALPLRKPPTGDEPPSAEFTWVQGKARACGGVITTPYGVAGGTAILVEHVALMRNEGLIAMSCDHYHKIQQQLPLQRSRHLAKPAKSEGTRSIDVHALTDRLSRQTISCSKAISHLPGMRRCILFWKSGKRWSDTA